MIRKTNLMLGDWVSVPGIGTGKVLELGELAKVYYAKTDAVLSVDYYNLEPVKITTTWLKSNNFAVRDEDHTFTEYSYKHPNESLSITYYKISKRYVIKELPHTNIDYIHQLQHFLKLVDSQILFYLK